MSASLSLSQLWAKTNGIYIEAPIIYLRVQSEDQPVSYVPNQVWLASYEKLKNESGWSIGIWGNFLRSASAEDTPAVTEIIKEAGLIDSERLKAGLWVPVPVTPRKDEVAANP